MEKLEDPVVVEEEEPLQELVAQETLHQHHHRKEILVEMQLQMVLQVLVVEEVVLVKLEETLQHLVLEMVLVELVVLVFKYQQHLEIQYQHQDREQVHKLVVV